jgi:hypothetical protein
MRRLALALGLVCAGCAADTGPKGSILDPGGDRSCWFSHPVVEVTTIDALPEPVQSFLVRFFHASDGLAGAMAEPGAWFQATDVPAWPRLPSRRMIRAGHLEEKWLVAWEQGGFTTRRMVALFDLSPDADRVARIEQYSEPLCEVADAMLDGEPRGAVVKLDDFAR